VYKFSGKDTRPGRLTKARDGRGGRDERNGGRGRPMAGEPDGRAVP
jgi:hypothetical protein